MNKKILGIALAAMSLVSFTGMAQNVTKDNNVKQEKVCGKKDGKRDGKVRPNPFDGLQLSDAQKAQLQQLNDKRKAERQQMKEARKENRKAEAAKDLTARQNAKKAYLEEVKAIIGPEQYVIFLENSFIQKGDMKKGPNKAAMAKGDRSKNKNMKDGKGLKAHRGDKARKGSSENQKG